MPMRMMALDVYDTQAEMDNSDPLGQVAVVVNPPMFYVLTASGYQPVASLAGASLPAVGNHNLNSTTHPDVSGDRAAQAQEARAKQVIRVLHAGAAELAWSTRYEVDYGLRWDAERQVWVATDGFAYDGERLYDYSRQGVSG